MEYCCHVWAGAPSCYLDMLDKLQKQDCRNNTSLTLGRLVHQNVATIDKTFVQVHLNWLNWFLSLILVGSPLAILIDCMITLYPFLDVIRISMSLISNSQTLEFSSFFLLLSIFSLSILKQAYSLIINNNTRSLNIVAG